MMASSPFDFPPSMTRIEKDHDLDIPKETTPVKTPASAMPQQQPQTVDGKKARDQKFATLTNDDILKFQQMIGEENVLLCPDEVSGFVVDVTKKYRGVGSIVLTPVTTEQVSECLKYCNERMIATVP